MEVPTTGIRLLCHRRRIFGKNSEVGAYLSAADQTHAARLTLPLVVIGIEPGGTNQIRDAKTVRVGDRRSDFTLDDGELVRASWRSPK
jgi:hypothetical protein